jgi:hypothetical protein
VACTDFGFIHQVGHTKGKPNSQPIDFTKNENVNVPGQINEEEKGQKGKKKK